MRDICKTLNTIRKTLVEIEFRKSKLAYLECTTTTQITSIEDLESMMDRIKNVLDELNEISKGVPTDVAMSNFLSSCGIVEGALDMFAEGGPTKSFDARTIVNLEKLLNISMMLAGYWMFFTKLENELTDTPETLKSINQLMTNVSSTIDGIITGVATALSCPAGPCDIINTDYEPIHTFTLLNEQKYFTHEEQSAIDEAKRVAEEQARREQEIKERQRKMEAAAASFSDLLLAAKVELDTSTIEEFIPGAMVAIRAFCTKSGEESSIFNMLCNNVKAEGRSVFATLADVSANDLYCLAKVVGKYAETNIDAIEPESYYVCERGGDKVIKFGTVIEFVK
jgi:hypothetical protein